MVTALYARVSTDAQAEEGYSIDIHGERLQALEQKSKELDNQLKIGNPLVKLTNEFPIFC